MATTRNLHAFSGGFLVYGALVLAALFSVWPIFTMALLGYGIDLSQLLTPRGIVYIAGLPNCGLPSCNGPTPAHYLEALSPGAFPARLENTIVVSAISIGIALATGMTVAYALVRLPVKGKGLVSYTLLVLRMLSPFAVVVALYAVFTQAGLWDTYFGVALGEELAILAVVVWLLRGFFSDIPREIYDAAAVFGASEGQIFRRIALRMVVPGIAVTSLFAFVLVWNEFTISSFLTGPAIKTMAVGVWTGLAPSASGSKIVSFDEICASGFLSWIPAVVVVLSIRRYLAKGYSLGTASSHA
jgi:multiple sugar transport system permease protein